MPLRCSNALIVSTEAEFEDDKCTFRLKLELEGSRGQNSLIASRGTMSASAPSSGLTRPTRRVRCRVFAILSSTCLDRGGHDPEPGSTFIKRNADDVHHRKVAAER